MSRLLVTFALALTLAGCSQNPKGVQITDANKDSFVEQIKSMTGLTVEETQLLMTYEMRRSMAKSMGRDVASPAGKTVGALIEEERKFRDDQKVKAAEDERLAAEAKAKQDAKVNELRGAIAFAVYEKGFADRDYSDKLTLRCAYENKSGKEIRAFRGSVQFTDLFGTPIYGVSVTIQDPIAAGAKGEWAGEADYNQFTSEHVRFRNTELKDMKVVWTPLEVLFTDGATMSAESK